MMVMREHQKQNLVRDFQSPCVKENSEGDFLKVSYNAPSLGPRISRLGRKFKQWEDLDGNRTLDPINLMCRSFNAFATGRYRRKGLDGIEGSEWPSCKLSPSCLDMKSGIDCELCIAGWSPGLLYGSGLVSFLISKEREKLHNVLTLTRSEHDLKRKYFKVRSLLLAPNVRREWFMQTLDGLSKVWKLALCRHGPSRRHVGIVRALCIVLPISFCTPLSSPNY
jgi:hypothetical protein